MSATKSNSNSSHKAKSSKSSHPSKSTATSKSSTSSTETTKRDRNSEFICKIKYQNNLPPIPFDPKLLSYPFDKLRFVKYQTISLDKNYKHLLHTEPDLGIPVDLIDPSVYLTPAKPEPPHPEDLRIIEPSDAAEKAAKRSRIEQVRPTVPWLIKTTYMGPVTDELHRPRGSVPEVQFGQRYAKEKKEEDETVIKAKQIQAIEETFELMDVPPKHTRQPELKPLQILPIFPDFELWPNRYTQVVIEDVLDEKMDPELKEALVGESIIKFYNLDPLKFFAYMVPKKRKIEEISEPGEGEEMEYEWIREYNYDVKKGTDPTYFFTMTQDAVYYDEITSKVSSTKLKQKSELPPLPSKITVVRRDLNEGEKQMREKRMNDLLQAEVLEQPDGEEIEDVPDNE